MNACSPSYACPVEAVIHLIGGKYKPLILWHLLSKPRRYSELRRLVSMATPKMLTQHLRELERDGLISRTVTPDAPIKTEYALTAGGRTLAPLLRQMCLWGERYIAARERQQA